MMRVGRAFLGWTFRVLIALDQLANALIGGDPDETISSRAAKGAARGVVGWCLLCRLLHLVDRDHCAKSLEPDEGDRDWWRVSSSSGGSLKP
jgi:hypothetical protein